MPYKFTDRRKQKNMFERKCNGNSNKKQVKKKPRQHSAINLTIAFVRSQASFAYAVRMRTNQ